MGTRANAHPASSTRTATPLDVIPIGTITPLPLGISLIPCQPFLSGYSKLRDRNHFLIAPDKNAHGIFTKQIGIFTKYHTPISGRPASDPSQMISKSNMNPLPRLRHALVPPLRFH